MRYEELRVQFDQKDPETYSVTLAGANEKAVGLFRVPVSRWDVEAAYGNIYDTNRGITRGIALESLDPVRELGSRLFRALFSEGPPRELYTRLWKQVEDADAGLRLRLVVGDDDLAALPWEFLFDDYRQDYVALSPRYQILREWRTSAGPRPAPPPVDGPLRVVAVEDGRAAATGREAQMFQSLREENPSRLEVEWLSRATPGEFRQALARGSFHVLHFAGHGDEVAGAPDEESQQVLRFADDKGLAAQVGAGQLRGWLSDLPPLRLVYLNTCRTDRLAAALSPPVPAALGMRDFLSLEGSLVFAKGFYRALLDGRPLEAAVAKGRQEMDLGSPGRREWTLPVFYLGVQEGTLLSPPSRPAEFAAVWPAAMEALKGLSGVPRDAADQVTKLQLDLAVRNWRTLKRKVEEGSRDPSSAAPQFKELEDVISRLLAKMKTTGS
jgi:hypothetical protein